MDAMLGLLRALPLRGVPPTGTRSLPDDRLVRDEDGVFRAASAVHAILLVDHEDREVPWNDPRDTSEEDALR
ncbi:MAG: hypothetical protein WC683_01285 [bacterium]